MLTYATQICRYLPVEFIVFGQKIPNNLQKKMGERMLHLLSRCLASTIMKKHVFSNKSHSKCLKRPVWF